MQAIEKTKENVTVACSTWTPSTVQPHKHRWAVRKITVPESEGMYMKNTAVTFKPILLKLHNAQMYTIKSQMQK